MSNQTSPALRERLELKQKELDLILAIDHIRDTAPDPSAMLAGEMGCPQRTDYTVIGWAANLGSRICGAAEGGQVLVSQTTYDLIEKKVEVTPIPGLQLKGVDHTVTAYHVTNLLE